MRYEKTCPMSREAMIDAYFLEHRAKLIDIAAFLDRLDRAADGPPPGDQPSDYRIEALCDAVSLLTDGQPHRAQRIMRKLSDPTTSPIPAAGTKGAAGAWNPAQNHEAD